MDSLTLKELRQNLQRQSIHFIFLSQSKSNKSGNCAVYLNAILKQTACLNKVFFSSTASQQEHLQIEKCVALVPQNNLWMKTL